MFFPLEHFSKRRGKIGLVLVIKNNFIAGNWTVGKGVGGIRLSKEGRASISNNIIVRNLTGGGIDCVDSYMEVENNIVMHNNYFHFVGSKLKEQPLNVH